MSRPEYLYAIDYRSVESLPLETIKQWVAKNQNVRFAVIDSRQEIAFGKIDMGAHRERIRSFMRKTGMGFFSAETFFLCPHDSRGDDKTEVMSCSHWFDPQVKTWTSQSGAKGSFLGDHGPWLQVEKGGHCKSLNHKKACWHKYPNPGMVLSAMWKTGFWTMPNRVVIVGDDSLAKVATAANVDYSKVYEAGHFVEQPLAGEIKFLHIQEVNK